MDDDRIAGSAREATETLRDGSRDVAKKVGEYTLGALLVAVGVGFALAVLMADTRTVASRSTGAITGTGTARTGTGTGSLLPLATIDRMYKQVRSPASFWRRESSTNTAAEKSPWV